MFILITRLNQCSLLQQVVHTVTMDFKRSRSILVSSPYMRSGSTFGVFSSGFRFLRGGPGSIPGFSVLTKCLWDGFVSLYCGFPCQYHSTNAPYSSIHLPPTLYNVSLPVLQFPLSVSFHHCSILIHPSTTHAV